MIAGDKVVYPCQGPCLIESVVLRSVGDSPQSFYHLIVLVDGGGELFVPVDKAQTVGLRLLLKASEIPNLLDRLTGASEIAQDRKQRAREIVELFATGSAFDLAEIVKSLTELGQTKALTSRESWTLEKAMKFLVCEISEVLGETRIAAEKRVTEALGARKVVGVNRFPDGLSSPEGNGGHPEETDG